ncbi:MAG: hypothetical protein LUQ54_06480 [Methanoregula sp.]|nr:hypothetical protein [Methanoregula sp.]
MLMRAFFTIVRYNLSHFSKCPGVPVLITIQEHGKYSCKNTRIEKRCRYDQCPGPCAELPDIALLI